ncbi:Bacterial extracellular solute-binding protein, family 7 [Pelagimonas phthalicica]|uniref:Bacterial extracellular solute-binding protein, family 7 n=1 Tax=Pelagimonas phthalicica TaxID=1037362 RepID=A0A238JG71_9RHOB|nr:TRAP transporter substrate-binding protein DctP [Pelagimonas phthalicica]TDS92140.1 TRAP-type C4-dicarboxylate transport system substrate-binding protein [Pelagimonas phthalicica]SMX29194.1 Bacterial extracellular solute-binding protein, family 7 [Pelagimonas phthalicica]
MKLKITALALAAAIGLNPLPAAAETDLSFNIFFPPTHYIWPVFQTWADDVSKATGGEVKITFPAKSVAPPPGVMDAVRNGVADAGFVFNGFIAKNAPATLISQMPWLNLGDTAAVSTALWDTYTAEFAEHENLRGVELISMFNLGPAYLCSTTDDPIETLEHLQQRRIWALPGTIANTFSAMDLAIVAGPAVQVQELTSRNTVDAHMGLTAETIVSFGVAPYTKSCVDMLPSMQSANFSVFVNDRAWKRLSDENRAAVRELSGAELARRIGEATNEAEAAALTKLQEMGVVFNEPSDGLITAIGEASGKIAASWAESVSKKYGTDTSAILDALAAEIQARTENK